MDISALTQGRYCSILTTEPRFDLNNDAIAAAASNQLRLLSLPRWREVVALIDEFSRAAPCKEVDLTGATIVAGGNGERDIPEEILKNLIPWRKGPFNLCGREIDAEWRSDLKWDRIAPALGDLRGKKIADVGCNNGYFMFRLAALSPELVVGFDPVERCYLQFMLAQSLIQHPALTFEPLGIEDLSLFRGFFDLVLCLGVIYHRTDPLGALRLLKDSSAPGGKLIIESQIIPGNDPVALYPPDRYGKAKNIHLLPTVPCLVAWLVRTGFSDIEVISVAKTTPHEQRTTALAPWESLKDFLDPNDPSKTVEGYPAPARAALSASVR